MNPDCECPRCGCLLNADPERNARSKRDNKTCICSYCGRLEFREDMCDLPNPDNLPRFCYSDDYGKPPKTVMIIRGTEGFFKTTGSIEWTDHRILNQRLGIDDETSNEMRSMSMFGWGPFRRCPDCSD